MTTTFQIQSPPTIHKPTGYSHVAEVHGGKIVYIAGQVAQDASGALVGKDDLRAQVQQIFINIRSAIESAGGTCHDIIKLNWFCCDRVPASEMPRLREVRDQFVNTQAPPVSTFVFVSRLVRPEWMIEVEAVAVIEGAR